MTQEQEVTISQAMEIALHCHKAGQLHKAIEIYRQILRVKPDIPEVHGNLGSALKQQGKLDEAALCYRRALALKPEFAEMHFNLGNVLFVQDRLAEAENCYRQALALKPEFAPLYNNLGNALEAQDRFEEAEACYHYAIGLEPDFAELHYNLGNVLKAQGKPDEAAVYYRNTLNLQPDFVDAHTHLGNILRDRRQFEEATLCYRRAVKLKPDFAEAYNSLGTVLQAQNFLEEAVLYYRHALSLKPDFAEVYNNLGNVLFVQSRPDDALICYRYALILKPGFAEAYNNFGNLLKAMLEIEEAEYYYQQASTLKPNLVTAYNNLAEVLYLQGKFVEARLNLHLATKLDPHNSAYRLNRLLLLPIIPRTPQDISDSRQRLERNLAYLANQDLHLTDPWKEGVFNNLFFTSPAVANRTLRSQLASLYQRACPSLLYTASHCADSTKPSSRHDKIKIGVVLKLVDQDHFGQLLCHNIMSNFSKEQFSFQVFVFSPTAVTIPDLIQQQADNCDILPIDLELARRHIAQRQLDLLFYPEIGPEPFLYFLAFARLAPVQCAVWEDAVTAGLPNFDYFLTNQPPVPTEEIASATHFSVIHIGNLRSSVDDPPLLSTTATKTRQAFGLADQHHLYLCPQALHKVHPDFDLALAAILERDPQGQIVFLEGHYPHWTELLQQRFFHTIPKVINRLHFLPRQQLTECLPLADVMLDTFYWGGTITTYQALSMGIPVVALSTPSFERQFAYAYYQERRLMECVADTQANYIEIALRLGTDSGYRETVKARLLETNRRLWEDNKAVRELEQFWVAVTNYKDR